MPKLNLNTITSRYASVAALNSNFNAIETAIDNTLSLDGSTPNSMSANLDMDSNRIVNLPDATTGSEPLTLAQWEEGATNTPTSATAVTYTPVGTGATVRTVAGKLQECRSVTDFGAVGDGVTDDTSAINAAIPQRQMVF